MLSFTRIYITPNQQSRQLYPRALIWFQLFLISIPRRLSPLVCRKEELLFVSFSLLILPSWWFEWFISCSFYLSWFDFSLEVCLKGHAANCFEERSLLLHWVGSGLFVTYCLFPSSRKLSFWILPSYLTLSGEWKPAPSRPGWLNFLLSGCVTGTVQTSHPAGDTMAEAFCLNTHIPLLGSTYLLVCPWVSGNPSDYTVPIHSSGRTCKLSNADCHYHLANLIMSLVHPP